MLHTMAAVDPSPGVENRKGTGGGRPGGGSRLRPKNPGYMTAAWKPSNLPSTEANSVSL